MEYNPNPNQTVVLPPVEQHRKDGVTAMVLGIIGLALSWWGVFTIAALILSIIGFVRAKKNREFARSQNIPEIGQNKAGYICSLIGLILSAIAMFVIIAVLVILVIFGTYIIGESIPYIADHLREYASVLPSMIRPL